MIRWQYINNFLPWAALFSDAQIAFAVAVFSFVVAFTEFGLHSLRGEVPAHRTGAWCCGDHFTNGRLGRVA